MTTIAFDGVNIACDSRMTSNGVLENDQTKKMFRVGDACIVGSGDIGEILRFVEWWKTGLSDTAMKPDFSSTEVLVVTARDAVCFDKTLFPIPIKAPYACGSGGLLALGAMLAGCDAIEAVKIASKRDIYTGGRIQSHSFN